jgi:hypothetical protein
MLALAVVATLLTASPPLKIASPGWSYVNIKSKQGDFFANYFAQQLAVRGFSVITAGEIASLLGFERQKQLLGCATDATSCAAELAGALGVDALITGSLARFKGGFTVTIKIVAARDGRQLAVDTGRVKDEDELIDWLQRSAERMVPALKKAAPPPGAPQRTAEAPAKSVEAPPEAVAREPEPAEEVSTADEAGAPAWLRPSVLIPAAAGVLAVAGGTVALVQARGIHSELSNPQSSYWDGNPDSSVAAARSAAAQGSVLQTLGYVGLGLGAAAIATGVVLALRADSEPAVSAVLTKDAGLVSVGVTF